MDKVRKKTLQWKITLDKLDGITLGTLNNYIVTPHSSMVEETIAFTLNLELGISFYVTCMLIVANS